MVTPKPNLIKKVRMYLFFFILLHIGIFMRNMLHRKRILLQEPPNYLSKLKQTSKLSCHAAGLFEQDIHPT
jgi:hypothetical protein